MQPAGRHGCHSTDHILAIQWAFVSLGRVVERSFPLVAWERREFSLGCVSSLVCDEGDDLGPRLRSFAGGMPASTGNFSTGML